MRARLIAIALLANIWLIAAGRLPCGRIRHRTLQQTDDSSLPTTIMSPSSVALSGNGTTVSMVEVDLLQLECIISSNTYIDHMVGQNTELIAPGDNLRASAEDCCISCHKNDRCNAWVWCPDPEGCTAVNKNRTADPRYLAHKSPYQGCELVEISAFSPYDINYGPGFRVSGPDVPFVSGVPFNLSVPSLPEYDVMMGVDVRGNFDYVCDALGKSPCILNAPSTDVSLMCNNDPMCQGFVYFPEGVDLRGTGPVGILKSSGNDNAPVSRTDTAVDPAAATYFKRSLMMTAAAEAARSEESAKSTVVVIVVATLGAVLAIGGIVGGVMYVRRYRQLARSFPDSSNVNGSALANRSNGVRGGEENIRKNSVTGTVAAANPTGAVVASMRAGSNSSSSCMEEMPSSDELNVVVVDSRARNTSYRPPQQLELLQQVPLPVIEISELPAAAPLPASLLQLPAEPQSSSARELLEAFSVSHRQRPQPDYAALVGLLETEDDGGNGHRSGDSAKSYTETPYSSNHSTPGHTTPTKLSVVGAAASSTAYAAVGALNNRPATTSNRTNEVSIRPEDVEICRHVDGSFWELGTGAFGRVYKGRYRGSHNVAVKVLHRLEEPRASEAFVHEVALLRTLRHGNVVRFLGACLDGPGGTALLVTELMELGDLWRALPARSPSGERIFAWRRRGRAVVEDVVRGLAYLHAQRLVHFDLKSANILLSKRGTAKLADIGMARVLCKSYFSVISGLGTFAWSAPEVLAGKRCSEKADIYSFGVVLWEVCTGEPPTRGHMRPLQPNVDCPAEVVQLYNRCIAENPEERPSAQEILGILAVLPDD